MWIQAEKMLFEDLRPGDLWGHGDQAFWDMCAHRYLFGEIYVRFDRVDTNSMHENSVVYRLTIHHEKAPLPPPPPASTWPDTGERT